jgi:REP element-mobilizing transposase RayT
MARKPRIESNDGVYHVLNRGNYRRDVFYTAKSKEAFEQTVFEVSERSGWWLYGYVIMRNHYHLALHTPRGNLISGMQWLQSTYANRYNRMRNERGHLFQGRYKSPVVEPGESLVRLINYIHLNPVRAGAVLFNQIERYPYSSLPKYMKGKKKRPKVLHCQDWLYDMGKIEDHGRGWQAYKKQLELSYLNSRKEESQLSEEMSRGWCIGSLRYKKSLIKEYKEQKPHLRMQEQELEEANELYWHEVTERCMKKLRKGPKDIVNDNKTAEWKLAIAAKLKEKTTAKNKWIVERLKMGATSALSHNVTVFRSYRRIRNKYSNILKGI